MTKKDYQMIAEVVATIKDWDTRAQFMVDIGKRFEQDNPRFDYWLFKRAVEESNKGS